MNQPSPVFTETYESYLKKIEGLDFSSIQNRLGIRVQDHAAVIPLLDRVYRVSSNGIGMDSGGTAELDVCVILCRYLLMAPDIPDAEVRWAAYRDLQDTGPLTVYWTNEVERKIARCFADAAEKLTAAGSYLNGSPPAEPFPYDFAMQFTLLPRIPALLLLNHTDDEFPATCSVLFDRTADQYLDAESLGMLGARFARRLTRVPTP